MRVYPSIADLRKELELGSVIVVPAMLMDAMGKHFNVNLVQRPDEGIISPFYIFEVDPYVTVLKEVKREYGVEFKARAEVPINVKSITAMLSASLELGAKGRDVELKVLDPSLVKWAHVYEALNNLRDLAETHRDAFAGRPVFMYTRIINPEFIEALSGISDIGVAPAYVAVPAPMTRVDPRIVEAVRKLTERGIKVGVLLGIEPDAIGIRAGDKVYYDLVPTYLTVKMIEDAVPVVSIYNRDYYRDIAYGILYRVYSEAKTQSGTNTLSISTVFLDALRSIVLRNPPQYGTRIHAWNTSFELYSEASRLAKSRADILATYFELAGASKETAELIRSTGWAFPSEWGRDVWSTARKVGGRVYEAELAEASV